MVSGYIGVSHHFGEQGWLWNISDKLMILGLEKRKLKESEWLWLNVKLFPLLYVYEIGDCIWISLKLITVTYLHVHVLKLFLLGPPSTIIFYCKTVVIWEPVILYVPWIQVYVVSRDRTSVYVISESHQVLPFSLFTIYCNNNNYM